MRVLLTHAYAPFMRGGAELHTQALETALMEAGHEVQRLGLPFKFSPESDIERLMTFCEGLDLNAPNGQRIDRLISLQFPGYGIAHDDHVVWLLHQHRAVYELFDSAAASPALRQLRQSVHDFDRRALSRVQRRWANSRRVAQRLQQFNGLTAQPLYHPPPMADQLLGADDWGYVFCPSRLESLKRQDLLIEAARHLRCSAKILIAGVGGQHDRYAAMIERYGLGDRVRLIGAFSDAEKLALYAHATLVAFVPFDEDLGYVTLEAMYASKPVLTCTDSGGPLEFVVHGQTGWVAEPDPQAVAETIEAAWSNPNRTRAMGHAGRERIEAMNLSWQRVVEVLCD